LLFKRYLKIRELSAPLPRPLKPKRRADAGASLCVVASAPLPRPLKPEREAVEGSADLEWPRWTEAPHTQRGKGEERGVL